MKRALFVALLFGCAPRAVSVTPDHPANPAAPAGRLAGPPAALHDGVAEATPVMEPPAATGHEHHQAPASPDPETTPAPTAPTTDKPKPPPKKPPAKQPKPEPAKPKPPKQPPGHQGHEGHH